MSYAKRRREGIETRADGNGFGGNSVERVTERNKEMGDLPWFLYPLIIRLGNIIGISLAQVQCVINHLKQGVDCRGSTLFFTGWMSFADPLSGWDICHANLQLWCSQDVHGDEPDDV